MPLSIILEFIKNYQNLLSDCFNVIFKYVVNVYVVKKIISILISRMFEISTKFLLLIAIGIVFFLLIVDTHSRADKGASNTTFIKQLFNESLGHTVSDALDASTQLVAAAISTSSVFILAHLPVLIKFYF